MDWQEHPVLKPPTNEELALMKPEQVLTLHQQYHAAIKNAAEDPLNCGFKMPHWEKADALVTGEDATNELIILGGNRSGKTIYGARSVVKAAIENPGSTIFVFSQNAEVSVRQVQSAVYDWLPPHLRKTSRSAGTYLSFKRQTGFAGASFILPNESRVIFRTYTAFAQDPSSIEGAELGSFSPSFVNFGVWCDEYLGSPTLLDTLRFRCATRNAKILATFTPIWGYSETVRLFLHQAETIEQAPAELLGGELVPVSQRSKLRDASVIYFHSAWNPFGGFSRIASDLANSSRDEILTRAYGVPVRSSATVFPMFSREVNVVKPEQIPMKDVTTYQIIDPGGSKDWCACWVNVDASGTFWVWKEYPDGEDWAEWRTGEWRPGPGARGKGYGIRDFVRMFYEMEGGIVTEHEDGRITTDTSGKGVPVYERIIDPRMAKIQTPGAGSGAVSILSNLDDMDFVCQPALIPGGGQGHEIEQGLQALNDLMSYDRSQPVDAVNRPKFYVSEDCQNIISALGEYTGQGGLKEAWKDPIDCLRYAAISNLQHVDDPVLRAYSTNQGSYGAPNRHSKVNSTQLEW
tara:strand:- start:2493 stop:4217 length:1725 start_codon:yes stop_codon:yes gene_type:complete